MAHYIFGFIRKDSLLKKQELSKLFEEEIYFFDTIYGYFFRVTSNLCLNKDYSRGIKIDSQRKVFSVNNVEGIHQFTDGVYIDQSINDEKIKISADKFGLSTILYTTTEKEFFVSDSLLALAFLRRLVKSPVVLNRDDFVARSWLNAITYSLISPETSISEIYYLLPGFLLSFDYKYGQVDVVQEYDLIANSSANASNYYEVIQEEAANILGLFISLSEYYKLSFSVSGGLDSRVLIGIADLIKNKKVKGNSNNIYINCNSKRTNDFVIVEGLAEKYDLPLNKSVNTRETRVRIPKCTQWAISSLGVYDPLYASGGYKENIDTLVVGGHSAGVYKGAYGWRSTENIGKASLPYYKYQLFQKQLRKNNCIIDYTEYEHISSEIIYLYYRSAIHGSRFLSSSLATLRPLLISSFVNIVYNSHLTPSPVSATQISKDLAIFINPEIASEEYDHYRKNVTNDYKDRVLKNKNHDIPRYYDFEVLGDINEISNKPISFVVNMAEQIGFKGSHFSKAFNQLKNLILKNSIKYGVNQECSFLMSYLDQDLTTPKAEAAAGKLFILTLLD